MSTERIVAAALGVPLMLLGHIAGYSMAGVGGGGHSYMETLVRLALLTTGVIGAVSAIALARRLPGVEMRMRSLLSTQVIAYTFLEVTERLLLDSDVGLISWPVLLGLGCQAPLAFLGSRLARTALAAVRRLVGTRTFVRADAKQPSIGRPRQANIGSVAGGVLHMAPRRGPPTLAVEMR